MRTPSPTEPTSLLEPLKRLHTIIRESVVHASEHAGLEEMATVAKEEEGDTIYAVDRISEELLVDFFKQEIAPVAPIILIAEGLAGGKITLPQGVEEADAHWRIIVDPID